MNTSKKKGLGRGLTALFGDQKKTTNKSDKKNNDGLKASIADLIAIDINREYILMKKS